MLGDDEHRGLLQGLRQTGERALAVRRRRRLGRRARADPGAHARRRRRPPARADQAAHQVRRERAPGVAKRRVVRLPALRSVGGRGRRRGPAHGQVRVHCFLPRPERTRRDAGGLRRERSFDRRGLGDGVARPARGRELRLVRFSERSALAKLTVITKEEEAMSRHVRLSSSDDHDWYRELYEDDGKSSPADGGGRSKRRNKRKDEDEPKELKVYRLPMVRELAFEVLAPSSFNISVCRMTFPVPSVS